MKKRLFVLGSCVSRDALDAVPGRFELVGYLARTSMASIGLPVVDDPVLRKKVAGLPSPFQQRMIFNDLDKSTLEKIHATAHDILLLDFIDERFDLAISGDSLFSISGELLKAGYAASGNKVLHPDEEAFMLRWMEGLTCLLKSVDKSKVVLNRAYWAERFPDGSNASSIGWIRRNNALLQRLYNAVDGSWGLGSIHYPQELLVSDPHHKWGVAPYHYTGPMYQYAVDEIERIDQIRTNGVA